MRKVILILLVFISAKVNAQVYQEMPQYGYRANRMAFDSTLQIPTVCGVPTLKSIVKTNKNGAIAYDSCNARFYAYNPKTLTWTAITGGGSTDTTSLSNRINLKIDSLKRSNDSVYAYRNGTRVFQFKDSVGGGGLAGTGTQYFVPKWSNSTTLQNSQIFDSVNVGINTTTPAYKLDVNGEINTNQGIRIGTNGAKTGFYGGANIIDFFAGENKISTWGLTAVGGSYFDYFPSFTYNTGDAGITNILKIRGNATSNSANNAGVTQLDISPTYTQQTFGTGTLRGIYYNPLLASGGINTSKHIAFESAFGNIVMKGLKKSSSTTDSIAIWINDTLSKAPYPTGGGIAVDTIFRTLGKDSIFYKKNNITYAIKDSVGGGGVPYTGATQDVDLGAFKISAQSFQVEGTNGLGHIHFKHQNSDATATGQSTVLYANSNGDLKYKNANKFYSTLKTQQTADRVYTFQNKSYTLADSSDLSAKLNIADTSTLQSKSISSYTILANNTSATANVTAQQFRDTSGVYNGTITWTGTTAPSGATTHTYRLTQVGKCVTLHIALVFATNGAALTAVTLTLPSGAPTPVQPTGLTGASANMYPVNGQLASSANNSILSAASRGFLRNNAAGNGFEILLNFGSIAPGQLGVTVQYWTN